MSDSESHAHPLALEIKALRFQLISLKKSVTQGDKKQKKAIQEQVAALEAEIQSKQAQLRQVKEAEETANEEQDESEAYRQAAREKKERRAKERAATWEANRQAALEEASQRPDWQGQEAQAFAHRLQERGFELLEVAADGHCLFSAIGCQLPDSQDHWHVRNIAAEWMSTHRDAFEPFLDEELPFEEYCERVRRTGQWGGQLELQALADALPARITVIQASGDDLCFGEGNDLQIYLSYHRHAFSLGEHYNALIKKE